MLLPFSSKKNQTQSYILITDGFDELEVVYILHKFRHAGLRIKIVSLFDRLVYSYQGVGLKADVELADVSPESLASSLLILPTGGNNGEALRRDARIKSLLENFSHNRGHIVVTNSQSLLATDIDRLLNQALYHPVHGQDLGDFVDSLASRMAMA